MAGSTGKRHHYIPMFEQTYFSYDGVHVWVFFRDKAEIKALSMKDTALIKDYYRFTMDNGEKWYGLEEAFTTIEGHGATVVKKLQDRTQKIDINDKWNLSYYLVLKWGRTPHLQNHMEAIAEVSTKYEMQKVAQNDKQLAEAVNYALKNGVDTTLEEARKLMLDPNWYKIDYPRETTLQILLANMNDLAVIIRDLEWHVLYAPEGYSFITSDNPFFTINHKNPHKVNNDIGICSHDAITVVPISPKLCIFIHSTKGNVRYSTPPPSFIKDINKVIAINCRNILIAKDKKLLESIVKRSKINEIKYSGVELELYSPITKDKIKVERKI